jgi:hypothetical protein
MELRKPYSKSEHIRIQIGPLSENFVTSMFPDDFLEELLSDYDLTDSDDSEPVYLDVTIPFIRKFCDMTGCEFNSVKITLYTSSMELEMYIEGDVIKS